MTDVRAIFAFEEFPLGQPEQVWIGRQQVTLTPLADTAPLAWRIDWPQGYVAHLNLGGYSGGLQIADIVFDSGGGMTGQATMIEFPELAHMFFGAPAREMTA